jgi:predicted chitinase
VEETLNDNEDEITGEIKSDLKHVAVGVNKDFQNSFKGAYTQLEDFKRKFVEVTDTAMQGGPGKPEPVRSGTGEIVRDSSGQPVVTRPEAPLPVKQDAKENLAEIKKVLMAKGEKDQNYINAVLANILKETGGKRVEENLNYGKTSNERIRSIFGERAAGKSDAELNTIKSNPQQMGEMMYGSTTKIGQIMGNKEPGDGWKYRGRGYIQLTGKNNYAEASTAIFGDDTLVRNPDLVNDPRYASEIVAWFMEKSKKGMAKTLGINTGAMSQDQANLLATSQIAGKAITPGKGYLGGELLGKVSGYSQSIAKSDIGGASPGGVQVAAANQESSKPLSGSHSGETSGGQQRDTSKISTKDPREQIEQAGLKVRP